MSATKTTSNAMPFMTLIAGMALGAIAFANKKKIADASTAMGTKIASAFDDLAVAPARKAA